MQCICSCQFLDGFCGGLEEADSKPRTVRTLLRSAQRWSHVQKDVRMDARLTVKERGEPVDRVVRLDIRKIGLLQLVDVAF